MELRRGYIEYAKYTHSKIIKRDVYVKIMEVVVVHIEKNPLRVLPRQSVPYSTPLYLVLTSFFQGIPNPTSCMHHGDNITDEMENTCI